MKKGGLSVLLVFLCLCVAAGAWYYFRNGASDDAGPRTGAAVENDREAPVTVAKAIKGNIRVFLEELGNVTPRNTVTVHSRIDGELVNVLFQEGQLVKAGDLIAEIDSSPYRAQLMQGQGQLKKDQALLKEAQDKFARYKVLFGQDAIARQELDSQESLVNQYLGAVVADQGQIQSANVQIQYTRITSPITGRIGLRQIDKGNIVHTSDQNGIASITELQPITVVFSIPEDTIASVAKRLERNQPLWTQALDREEGHVLDVGRVLAIDTLIDTQTGTVKCKAEFPNKEQKLFPNQFVNTKVLLDVKRNATLIPASAIQHGSKGAFVFVVKGDNTVGLRQIKPGAKEADRVSVDSGIEAGDTVVTDGGDSLRDGSRISIVRDVTSSLVEKKIIKRVEPGKEPKKALPPFDAPADVP